MYGMSYGYGCIATTLVVKLFVEWTIERDSGIDLSLNNSTV